MNVINYDRELDKIISENRKKGVTPKVLLHSCCAPCSSACIIRLKDHFDVTVYYYNPNMDGAAEYEKRESEQQRLCSALGIKFIAEEYRPQEFYDVVKGLEDAPEGGARCGKCFELRLKRTAEKAKEGGFDYFCTTLTVSPLKNSALLNGIGAKIAEETGVKFLPSDFKKKGGYLKSVQMSAEYGLYRQNYCGCVFSKTKNPNFT